VVESISPQLSDFFGVDRGRGVLVRSIEKGSPADAAGLRAGDVIVKINNEVVHDVSDWRRSLRRQTGKVQLGIVRDKHPQTVEITLPGPQTTGSIPDFDWEQFGRSMDEYGRNMNQFGRDMEQFVPDRQLWANLHLDKQQLEDLRRQIESSMQELQPQLEQQMPEIRKQMEQWRPELQREMQELQKQLKEQSRQLSAMKPDARQLEEMRREIENSMKDLGPQFQRQMEEWRPQFEEEMRKFRGEMDRQKFDLQNKLPNSGSQYQF
jgi:molecular chaperone DnaK (HSP70)